LTARDLTAFGIAAIVELVFLVPSVKQVQMVVLVIFLFLFTAIACSFAALLMLNLPRWFLFLGVLYVFVCCFGEIIAWIIGWALIMEYSVGNITVAISWSDYFTGLLESGEFGLPQWVQISLSSRDLMMPQP
jgi:amino acid transporter